MLRLRDGVWARARAQVDGFLFLTIAVVIPKLRARLHARGLGAASRLRERRPASSAPRSLARHAPLGAAALLASLAIFSGESPQPLAGASAQALPPVQKDPARLVGDASGEGGAHESRITARDPDRSLLASAGQAFPSIFGSEPLWPHGRQLWIAVNAFRSPQQALQDVVQAREPESLGEAPQVERGAGESADIVGLWGPDASACSPRTNRTGLLPAVINSDGAWAGETSCRFDGLKRTAAGWQSLARCASGEQRWNSRVRLTVSGDLLVWASERGSQHYVRCGQALL
jgi:hypothetical protein